MQKDGAMTETDLAARLGFRFAVRISFLKTNNPTLSS